MPLTSWTCQASWKCLKWSWWTMKWACKIRRSSSYWLWWKCLKCFVLPHRVCCRNLACFPRNTESSLPKSSTCFWLYLETFLFFQVGFWGYKMLTSSMIWSSFWSIYRFKATFQIITSLGRYQHRFSSILCLSFCTISHSMPISTFSLKKLL